METNDTLSDLEAKILRHVSPAFVEDPLRVLRVARFYARFRHLGFSVAPETLELMRQISASGELAFLAAERIWLETQKALSEQDPAAYFECLLDVGALQKIMPELAALKGIPQTKTWHPEIDTFLHVMQCLRASRHLCNDKAVHFAVLTHDLGKGVTPTEMLPSHHGHEHAGLPLVETFCRRLKVSKAYQDLALKVCRDHLHFHRCFEMTAKKLLQLLQRIDGFRQPAVFAQWLLACEADNKGRGTGDYWKNRLDTTLMNTQFLQDIHSACINIRFTDLPPGLEGEAIGKAFTAARVKAIHRCCF